jgi:hypothetical protein
VPKYIVSTVSFSPMIPPERLAADTQMILWAGGLYGLTSVCKASLSQAAGAVLGAARAVEPPRRDRPLIGMTSLGSSCLSYMTRLKAPLEVRGAPFPDLTTQAAAVAAFEKVTAEVAAAAGVEWVAVHEVWPKPAGAAFTRDGLTLNALGLQILAGVVAGGTVPDGQDDLVVEVRKKNRLWESYWRPTNWAFLHGDRTAQPSSRDHGDPRQRWFPTEMEGFKGLIETKEQALWKKVNELGRKLP